MTDGKGEPIIGANVIQEGGIGTITDVEGNFTVTADLSKPLEISYIGYKKKSIRIGASPTINIALEEDAHVMDEVIVIGYGSKTKRDVTSSIGTYKPGEVNVRQVLGVDELLQGRVSGVNITSASGVPGSKNRVSIRGIGSITAGNEPLYVIDGVPINNTSGDTGAWGAQSMNGLNDFNPSDVESIQILKDAASAAIYGSRATNGVILITTKKGSKGQAKVNLDLQVTDDLAQLLRRLVRNIVMGLWVMALLISSSIICTTDMTPKVLGIPALGAFGYLLAFVIVLYVFIKHMISRK